MDTRRLARWCAVAFVMVIVAASQQGCRVGVYGAHVGWYWGCPHYRLVRIEGTDIHYVADVDDDVFYYGGVWYRYRGGIWYHTRVYGGTWVRISAPPAVFLRIPPGHVKARVCPALAVSVAWRWGHPHYSLAVIPGTSIQYVVDANEDIFLFNNIWYRFSAGIWYECRSYGGTWVRISSPPAVFMAIPEGHVKAHVRPKSPAPPAPPAAWRWGHPQYKLAVIPGTSIQYVVDVDDDIFFFGGVWYRFQGGGWYQSHRYGGEWVRISAPPVVFMNIPDGHPKSRVKPRPSHGHQSKGDREPGPFEKEEKGAGRPPEAAPRIEPPKGPPPREPKGEGQNKEPPKDREPKGGEAASGGPDKKSGKDDGRDKGKKEDNDKDDKSRGRK